MLGAGFVSQGESPDERDIHAPDEADFGGLARERRDGANDEGAFVLLEHEGADIGCVDFGINDGKMDLGKLQSHLADGVLLGETDPNDEVIVALRQCPHHRLERVVVGGFDILELNPKFALGEIAALVGRRVE